MKPTSTFTKADLKQLEEFLLSDKTPDECMDISSLHGYLTALVIGPETVLPSKWMPDIWGAEVIWDDMEEAQNIFGLVMSFYNTIIKSVTSPAGNFNLLVKSQVSEYEISVALENWCTGFMSGVDISFDTWEQLFESKKDKELMTPIVFFGTEKGRNTLAKIPESSELKFVHWVDLIQKSVSAVHSYWLPYRKEVHQSTHQAINNKVGRNDPCPCGSGKKFKNCCMN